MADQISSPPTQMRLALMWTLQAQFAGYVLARELELPELELVPRAADRSPIRELLDGRAEYGVVAPSHLLGVPEGEPELVLIALFMARSPVRLVGLRDRVGTRLEPRPGLRVGVWSGEDLELRAMLRGAGVALGEIEFVGVDDEAGALVSGEVDLVQATTYNELPAIAAAAGGHDRLAVHDPADWQVDAAKDGLAVRRDVLEADRPGVAEFVRGAIAGWRQALDRPDEAVAAVCRAVPNLDPASQRAQMDQLRMLFDPEQPLGEPRAQDVERARRAARAAGDPRANVAVSIDAGPWGQAVA
jgi:ABC-type nitrate/sulfonate/bicarbonate transport system substrate-binding protein